MKLDLVSEPFSRFGNIGAEGLSRVLGTPSADRLSIMVREVVQNSWDARKRDANTELQIRFRLRKLQPEQRIAMRRAVQETPEDGKSREAFADYFTSTEGSLVLEISDFGTVGLSGPTGINEHVDEGVETNFINFVRNAGTPPQEIGGGTFGFGRSSLYILSKLSTILVDSVTTHNHELERRFMFSHLGKSYETRTGNRRTQYTGRHWWGRRTQDAGVDPATGNQASTIASALGVARRSFDLDDTGTTIMVLDPDLDGYTLEHAVQRLILILLINFWPKMLPNDAGKPAISFEVFLENEEVRIPEVEGIAPLHLFARALRAARTGLPEDGLARVQEIVCGRPKAHLGYAAYATDMKLRRQRELITADQRPDSEAEDSDGHAGGITTRETSWLTTPAACNHYALMRSGELVVRYVAGPPSPQETLEWAGVFITSSEPRIEAAFARSEPPTHDDWHEESLSEPHERTFVRVAKRRLRDAYREFLQAMPSAGSSAADVSLGAAADGLGRLLPGIGGGGASSPEPRSSTPRGGRGGRRARVGRPEFSHFGNVKGEAVLIFNAVVTPARGALVPIVLQADPMILLEEKLVPASEAPVGTSAPRIVDMSSSAVSEFDATRNQVRFETSNPVSLEVAVSHDEDLAVGLQLRLVGPADG